MLKYLIIQLDDASTSYCHYENDRTENNLISMEALKDAIFWSMKENLTLQFLYPDYEIPSEYKAEIAETFHADIVPAICEDTGLRGNADVVVFDSFVAVNHYPFQLEQSYVFRTTMQELFDNAGMLYTILPQVNRINILITDIQALSKESEVKYEKFLDSLSSKVVDEYKSGHALQVNLLTDRIMLDAMNNCNAGDESIALCPDGKFYVCPAFYIDGVCDGSETSHADICNKGYSIGSIKEGLDIKNSQLYKLNHAPICRNCDAYQCKRCVWLNRKTTLEVNTPSHEQCVISHIERNASRTLLERIREIGVLMPGKEIPEIDYIDPFDNIQK